MENYRSVKIYAVESNGILDLISFDVLGQLEDVKRDIKEGIESPKEDAKNVNIDINSVESIKEDTRDLKNGIEGVESIKEDVKDIRKDIKAGVKEGVQEGVESMKEDVEDMKKDIKEGVKEGVDGMKEEARDIKKDIKESVKECVEEVLKEMMKTIETHEMKEDSTRKRMENIEKSDITYPSVQALGELYLVGFIFASNMKLSP